MTFAAVKAKKRKKKTLKFEKKQLKVSETDTLQSYLEAWRIVLVHEYAQDLLILFHDAMYPSSLNWIRLDQMVSNCNELLQNL